VRLLLICLGGAAGSGARYLAGALVLRWLGPVDFPYATLGVNVLGSFLIGLVEGAGPAALPDPLRAAAVVGVLGGFTTYSAFAYQTLVLWRAGGWGAAALNVGLTTGVCLGACAAGLALGRALAGRGA
jgi:CrcB protein